MRRLIATAATLVAGIALVLPASATADGDPASDVLLGDTIFFPYTKPSPAVATKLRNVVNAARKAGVPLRVAIISSTTDLGAVPDYFGRPGEYARFLAGELAAYGQLAPTHKGSGKPTQDPLLIVMPAGIGTNGLPAETERELRSIDLGGNAGPDALASAAGYAVQEVAKKDGHPITAEFDEPQAAEGGGGVLVPVIVGLGLALLAGLAIWARVRASGQAGERASGQAGK